MFPKAVNGFHTPHLVLHKLATIPRNKLPPISTFRLF